MNPGTSEDKNGTMADELCPHCGSKLPLARDAFCGDCGQPLDESPEVPRTLEEQVAYRKQIELHAKRTYSLLLRLLHPFHWH
jgi:predicted amidophosphoribosyltransferase